MSVLDYKDEDSNVKHAFHMYQLIFTLMAKLVFIVI